MPSEETQMLEAANAAREQAAAASGQRQLSIVIPTFNERKNIAPLIERLEAALTRINWEVIFVDDASPDGTAAEVRAHARTDPRVRLILRHNRRGLASAVVEGALAGSADIVAVMDGDLQHDESALAEMYRIVSSGEADIASASRFLSTDAPAGLASQARLQISNTGIALANTLLGANMSDPLTGFFVMRRSALERALPKMSELGFKILLDIITSQQPRPKVREVAFTFRERQHGASKLDRRVMYEFFLFGLEKSIGRFVPLPARFLSFALINGVGIMVHLALLAPAVSLAKMDFSEAQLLATIGSMFFNYSVNNMVTYHDATLKGMKFVIGFIVFSVLCGAGVLANVGVATMLHREFTQISYVFPAIAGAMITVVWNYVATKFFVWGRSMQRRVV